MATSEIQVHHLQERLEQSIGAAATATFMEMVTALDVSQFATKEDKFVVIDRMDLRFFAMDEKWEARMTAMDEKWAERFAALEARMTAMDEKWEARMTAMDEKWAERFGALDHRFESLEYKVTAQMIKAINKHLTFSVTAMAAVSGMFTWLAR